MNFGDFKFKFRVLEHCGRINRPSCKPMVLIAFRLLKEWSWRWVSRTHRVIIRVLRTCLHSCFSWFIGLGLLGTVVSWLSQNGLITVGSTRVGNKPGFRANSALEWKQLWHPPPLTASGGGGSGGITPH